MTSELKPCPFCNYALSMSEGICPAQDCTDEDTGKWTFTGICCPSCAAFLPKKDESSSVPHGVAAWNTRAEPDVPELVRLDPIIEELNSSDVVATMVVEDNGEYVTYDQAAAVIAAKDAEVAVLADERYKLAYAICGGEDAAGLLDSLTVEELVKIQADNHARHSADIDALVKAEAKLAQINDQEPIKLLDSVIKHIREVIADCTQCEDEHMDHPFAENIGQLREPLYAAPVASDAELRAENERLRKSLEKIASLSHTTGLLWWQIEARKALNPSEPRT